VNVTEQLAEFVATTPTDSVGTEARTQAKRAILDTLGVALAGTVEDTARIVSGSLREAGGREEASVLGHDLRAPAAQAALANVTAAHALDYDDVAVNMRGHPSVPLLPAVLAVGEKLGSSGSDVLDAFVLGFEVECKLGRAIGGPHYALGWHATSTLGTIGAAAACTRLLKLDAQRTQTALAIAASLASGLRQNFGTMTKPLHAGWAAHNGVVAADLAGRGLTADARTLEGENGFLRAMSGGAEIDPTAAVRDLGRPWEIVDPGIGVKLYPCCYATHRAIDAALEVRGDGAAIDDIEVVVSPGTLTPLVNRLPETGLEGKFSMEYVVVASLQDGRVNLSTFSDDAVARPDVRALMNRVRVRDDGEPMQFPIGGVADVTVRANGQSRNARVEAPRGDPTNPLTWDELAAKFRDCAGLALSTDRVERLLAAVERLDELPDVNELAAATR
jgi:2-methylcitrate dehydratase PrpD